MSSTHCPIGELEKSSNGIVVLTIGHIDSEITRTQMIETVELIDATAQKPSPLLVDATQSHSLSFAALFEMAKATRVIAVAIYAPSAASQSVAEYIEHFQGKLGAAPYPFGTFSDHAEAITWLKSFM